jgi:membrane protein DedA with SNARE-associated domain
MFKGLIDWYMASLNDGGYWLVALLMAIESSVVPLPSEVVVPPAAYLATKTCAHSLTERCDRKATVFVRGVGPLCAQHAEAYPEPRRERLNELNHIGLVLAGAIGSWVGATAMYWASRWAGRPLVLRYGKYVLIPPEKVYGAEHWAAHYGSMGIFISRLLPVVRHLIGIPAGIVRMDYLKFSIYTLLGSAVWSAVLCWLGVTAGQDEKLMAGEMHRITLWLGGVVLALGVIYYFFVHRHMKAGPKQASSDS